jgi:hypothetical protein
MTNDSVFLPGEALILVDRQEFRCPLRASLASKTLELNDNTCDRQSIHYHSPLEFAPESCLLQTAAPRFPTAVCGQICSQAMESRCGQAFVGIAYLQSARGSVRV